MCRSRLFPGKSSAALIGVLSFSLAAGTAHASDEAKKAETESVEDEARALFVEARKLVAEGEHELACGKFEASLKLKVGIGTQYNLADCWEQIGRTASARKMFLRAAEAAREAEQDEREKAARDRAKALDSKVPKLAISVESELSGLVIERGTAKLDEASWGVAVAVDPGTYELKATAPGRKAWSRKVELPAAAETISVQVPELVEERAAPPKADPPKKLASRAKVKPASPNNEELNPQTQSWFTTGRKVGLVLAGVGVSGVTVGILASVQYKSKDDEARAICPSGTDCTRNEITEHDELVQSAKTARYWAFLGYGVGGAALIGAGVAFIAGANPPPGAKAGLSAEPWVSADGGFGGVLRGNW